MSVLRIRKKTRAEKLEQYHSYIRARYNVVKADGITYLQVRRTHAALKKRMLDLTERMHRAEETGLPQRNRARYIRYYVEPVARARQEFLDYEMRNIQVRVSDEGTITGET